MNQSERDFLELEFGEGGSKRLPPAIYTFDFETDPFQAWVIPDEQRIPKPFAVGVFCLNTGIYEYHWGDAESTVNFLMGCFDVAPKGSYFYAHNGGKFDFHFFIERIRGKCKVIGARIAEAHIGNVIVRDSFALLPASLKKFQTTDGVKLDIEMWKLESDKRDEHREEILRYMEQDCRVLGAALKGFFAEFGMHLTMAGAAIKQLQRFHEFDRLASRSTDEALRKFYYGGRVECIEAGVLDGVFKTYDVNSMYPAVMRNFKHPVSTDFIDYSGPYATKIVEQLFAPTGGPDFAEIDAENHGCLPCIDDKRKLNFRVPKARFFATGHEIRAGIETGTLRILKVHRAYLATRHTSFQQFVDHFYSQRLEAKARGDELLTLFYKLVLNSSYGKFAQNPEAFKDWFVTEEIFNTADGYVIEHMFPTSPPVYIWSRPAATPAHLMRFNVATAASVTGAARAQLWRGLCQAKRPIYCDTDSMICESFDGDIDPSRLGAWKFEGEASQVAIAGRKLYAMFNDGKVVKQASKGVRVSAQAIASVARGGEIEHRNEAPTFSLKKAPHFIKRRVRKTA